MDGTNDDSYNKFQIENCYVYAYIKTSNSGYAWSFVGRIKCNKERVLAIKNSVAPITIEGKYAGATTGGSDKNVLWCKVVLDKNISDILNATSNINNDTMYGCPQNQSLIGLSMTNTYFIKLNDGTNVPTRSTKQMVIMR